MKKICISLIAIFLLILAPTTVNALSVNLTVSCPSVIVGQTTTCTISGSTQSGGIIGVYANISVSGGASIESISTPGWGNLSTDPKSKIACVASSTSVTGSFTVGTVTIKGNSAGQATLRLSGIRISPDASSGSQDLTLSDKTGTFTVSNPLTTTTRPPATQAPTTKAPTPTQAKTTAIVTPTPTQPTTTAALPTFTELKLDSVTVGDYEVTYVDGKYYATVDYDTESVEIAATANENITIIGQGLRTLATGKNVVELILRNEGGESATVQVIITKPEDTNDYSTYLSKLKVVDYDFDFDKDTNEYTIYVPYNVNEVYVIAESNNVDVSILGDGLKSLQKGNNDIYINVQYGNKASNEYIIHVKRSYNSLIMLIAIGLLSAGLIGFGAFYITKQKKTKIENEAEKNKILAEANRTVANAKEVVSVNGQNVYAPGRVDLTPQQVVETKTPTNPVTVATSAQTSEQPAAENQVRLVKTVNTVPVKVNTANSQPVVINTGK
ncbi:MAG: cadherin-like beta sandwich domain-containing protein [Erysipelotrichales bacterium]|nr:cadherin-like beta sandwich domain-containing protein [Erysipelotrichales bacterium]